MHPVGLYLGMERMENNFQVDTLKHHRIKRPHGYETGVCLGFEDKLSEFHGKLSGC